MKGTRCIYMIVVNFIPIPIHYRSLKTNSLKLHETITELSLRIVKLEEALATVQAQVSDEPHPLLLDGTVHIPLAPRKQPEDSEPTYQSKNNSDDEETEVIESLGVFSISDRGEVVFHEGTANTEVS